MCWNVHILPASLWALQVSSHDKWPITAQSRVENNGWSTDNVCSDWAFDRSNFRLDGHFDQSNSTILKYTKSFHTVWLFTISMPHADVLIVKIWAEMNWNRYLQIFLYIYKEQTLASCHVLTLLFFLSWFSSCLFPSPLKLAPHPRILITKYNLKEIQL